MSQFLNILHIIDVNSFNCHLLFSIGNDIGLTVILRCADLINDASEFQKPRREEISIESEPL